jgi:hypothetical protein
VIVISWQFACSKHGEGSSDHKCCGGHGSSAREQRLVESAGGECSQFVEHGPRAVEHGRQNRIELLGGVPGSTDSSCNHMEVRTLTRASKRARANAVVHMQKFKTPTCVTRDCREDFLVFGDHNVAIINWKTRDVTMAKTDHIPPCSKCNAACPTDHGEGGQSSSKGLQLTCQQQLFDGSRFKPKKSLHLWIHSLHLHVIGVHGALPNHKFVIFRDGEAGDLKMIDRLLRLVGAAGASTQSMNGVHLLAFSRCSATLLVPAAPGASHLILLKNQLGKISWLASSWLALMSG